MDVLAGAEETLRTGAEDAAPVQADNNTVNTVETAKIMLRIKSPRKSQDKRKPGRFRPGFPHTKKKEEDMKLLSLMVEVCEDGGFFFGQADLLLAHLDALHQEGHVAAKGAHGL